MGAGRPIPFYLCQSRGHLSQNTLTHDTERALLISVLHNAKSSLSPKADSRNADSGEQGETRQSSVYGDCERPAPRRTPLPPQDWSIHPSTLFRSFPWLLRAEVEKNGFTRGHGIFALKNGTTLIPAKGAKKEYAGNGVNECGLEKERVPCVRAVRGARGCRAEY